MPISAENSRLTCSMAAWPVDTSMKLVLLQFGQSSHPRPLPVSRTAPPATTNTQMPTVVTIARRRKLRRLRVNRSIPFRGYG